MEFKKPTILVVDDMTTTLLLLHDLLKDTYEVKIAKSGTKALEILESPNDIDLILLDIEASKELSYSSEMSDLAYRKWNSSAYHRNCKGNLVIDRKLKVGADVANASVTAVLWAETAGEVVLSHRSSFSSDQSRPAARR